MKDEKPLYEEESLLQRIKESPRTVSALIIILIVAAAIYAFSGDDQGAPAGQIAAGEAVTQELTKETEEAGEIEAVEGEGETAEEVAKPEGEVAASRDEQVETTEAEETVVIPEARKTDEGYVEVAQQGEGYTHLARRATTKWLSENQASYSVTDEHRIFVEDYIQNELGSGGMETGQEQMVSSSLIKAAVDAAGGLSEVEMQNLSQYTSALS